MHLYWFINYNKHTTQGQVSGIVWELWTVFLIFLSIYKWSLSAHLLGALQGPAGRIWAVVVPGWVPSDLFHSEQHWAGKQVTRNLLQEGIRVTLGSVAVYIQYSRIAAGVCFFLILKNGPNFLFPLYEGAQSFVCEDLVELGLLCESHKLLSFSGWFH